MALANVSVLLAQWGYNVLIVDWDLEAPGLEFFFKDYIKSDGETETQKEGILDLLYDVCDGRIEPSETPNLQKMLIEIELELPDSETPLHFLRAGKKDKDYFNKVSNLDLETFYRDKEGGFFIETLRNQWKQAYDFVLIDSRTGITDIGGVCTIQLPDILVLLFTANEQSLQGIIEIASKTAVVRQDLPLDRLSLLSVPIPSKFDSTEEFKLSQKWLTRFSNELAEMYANWLPKSVNTRDFLELTKIPYQSYFSFGEKLPVLEQGTVDRAGLGYAYETLAALIANKLESAEQLLENREEYVRLVSKKNYAVFLSFNSEDRNTVEKIATYLNEKTNLRPWFDQWELIPGEPSVENLKRGLEASQSCALFVGKSSKGPWQSSEVEAALQQQVKDSNFRVIPVLLPDAPRQPELPALLSDMTWVDFRKGLDDDDALWRLECAIRGVSPGRGRRPKTEKEISFVSKPADNVYSRIRQNIAELQQKWDLLSKKLPELERDKILETRADEKIRLEHKIAELKADLQQVEQQLADLDEELSPEQNETQDQNIPEISPEEKRRLEQKIAELTAKNRQLEKQLNDVEQQLSPKSQKVQVRNLIPHFIQEQYQKEKYEGDFDALTMFVDISGFTPMMQALMKKGHEGAGTLAEIMSDIFDPLVDTVYEWGGFVSTFAGDAFTAIFPIRNDVIPADEVVLHVLVCTEEIQPIFRRDDILGQFPLGFKVGVSQGNVNWGIVGRIEKTYFFRGEAIDGCVVSEHHAERGDVIFDENVVQLLRRVPGTFAQHIRLIEFERLEGGYYRLRKLPAALLQQFMPPEQLGRPELRKDVVAQFLPDAVIDFKETGEFRHIVPIFIAFDGISTIQELNDWAFVLIKNIKTFGGHLNHLDIGDRGSIVLCGFGAPIAYERIIDRALGFILSVKQDLKDFDTLSGLKFRAGITYGIAYTGIAGGKRRCEYTYYGEVVNLAARLMMQANWGEIYVSKEICDQTKNFTFEHTGDVRYKGFTKPVPTYTLFRKKSSSRRVFTKPMIGRRTELQQLQAFAAPIFDGKFAGVAYIHGEVGIGKRRLAYALQEELSKQHTINWFHCSADQILCKPFNPFITLFLHYFDQLSENTGTVNKKNFEKTYRKLIKNCQKIASETANECVKELKRTRSVIGAQIGLSWRDSLWEHLDAKGKYNNTLSAIKNFFLAHSLLAPTVIELEDGHWIDSDSLELLKVLTRNILNYPIFILSTLRYYEDVTRMTFQLEGIREQHIDLYYLSSEEVKQFAESELNGSISDKLHELLLEKTNGNPLFVQQLLRYFVENNVVTLKDNTWHLTSDTPGIPASIQDILAARIDHLSEEVKEIVKAAAVIGREFDIVLLSSILKKDVFSQVQIISEAQIWEAVPEVQYGFKFKHALLRDTAYEMQLEARCRELHQVIAETMEKLHPAYLKKQYANLAFHYEKAKIRDKAIEYLQKAGDEAKTQYQNQQAIRFYNRLLLQLQNVFGFIEVEIDTLLKKAEILELIGNWKECQEVCEEALRLSEQINDKSQMGEAKLLSGIIFRQTGQYDDAMTYFKQAVKLFETVNDKQGIGRVFTSMGTVFHRKGNYDEAIVWSKKALKINEHVGNTLGVAKNANSIGVVYDMQGDYNTAMRWYQKSLQICEKLGEKLEMSRVLNNIGENLRFQGNYDAAMTFYNKTLTIAENLGDKLQIATTLGNIGHTYKAKDDYDRSITGYNRAIAIGRQLGNKFYLSEHLIEKAEALFSLQRYEEAQLLNQEGLRIAEQIDDKEYIFKGKLLSTKIAFALENEDAPRRLEDMLQQTQDKAKIATLHYELWKMTHKEDHRQIALNLYQALYKSTPNIDYKTRMEEMNR